VAVKRVCARAKRIIQIGPIGLSDIATRGSCSGNGAWTLFGVRSFRLSAARKKDSETRHAASRVDFKNCVT